MQGIGVEQIVRDILRKGNAGHVNVTNYHTRREGVKNNVTLYCWNFLPIRFLSGFKIKISLLNYFMLSQCTAKISVNL
jgi:hypothetical protein